METSDKDIQKNKGRSTFAILFYINRTKARKDGTCQLLCNISIDGKSEMIGIKKTYINPRLWNPDEGRAKGRGAEALKVNKAIDMFTESIRGHYTDIKRNLGFVTAELVKNAVKGIAQKPVTLLKLFEEHNDEFKRRIGVDRKKEAYESYLNSYKHLSAFIRRKYDTGYPNFLETKS